MLSEDKKAIFGKIAWTLHKKGHLTIDAITRFTKGATKQDIKKFIKLGWLKKHRTDTYEPFSRAHTLVRKEG